MENLLSAVGVAKWVVLGIIIVYAIFLFVNAFVKTKRMFANPNSGKVQKIWANFHTHTTFCDGKNTPEEMVEAAINSNMSALGFSGHSHLPTEPDWTMSEEGTKEYKETVLALREKYKDQIEILLGIEQDYWSKTDDLSDYDFVIGSVHSIFEKDITNSAVDGARNSFNYAVDNYFGGDRMAAAERYFELVGDLYERTHCDIIGHFDLITKYNEKYIEEKGEPFIDSENPRFIEAERKALEKLVATPVIFEINTGGMGRGFRSTPYPSERVMAFLSKHQTPVILASDAHKTDTLTSGFDTALTYVEKYNLNLINTPRIQ